MNVFSTTDSRLADGIYHPAIDRSGPGPREQARGASRLRSLLANAHESIRPADAEIDALRLRIESKLREARAAFDDSDETESTLRERVGAAVTHTDDYVRHRPWQTVAAVAGIAFLLGAVVRRP